MVISSNSEIERGAMAKAGERPRCPAVTAGNAHDGRKADAGTLELVGCMKPLEHSEELPRVGHVEAHPVVAHEIADAAFLLLRAGRDPGGIAAGGELDCIGQQVGPNLLQDCLLYTSPSPRD